MKNCRNLLFLLLLASCSNSDPKTKAANTSPVQPNKPVQEQKTDTVAVKKTKVEFIPQSSMDTALAVFLYKNYKNFDPNAQFMEYMRWDLHHEKIKPLLAYLYFKGQNKNAVLDALERNRQAFHDKAVVDVLDGYRNGSGIYGISFVYLVQKNDETVLPLLQDVINSPKAPAQEKEYAMKILKNWKGGGHGGK